MRPQAIFEELRGQRLTSILVHDPWDEAALLESPQFRWLLFGAMALGFERHALLLSSPLRCLRCQQGTRYGLADGSSVSLGFRALPCDAGQAEALVSWRLGLPSTDVWSGWHDNAMPVIGQTLSTAPWLCLPSPDRPATVWFDFGEGRRYRLEYRQDLDGAIEFAPEGVRSEPEPIELSKPSGPFGWLHPRSIRGFVLDDRRWRDTEHWPIEVRRQYRDAEPQGAVVLGLLKRAWLAYFRQYPDMGRRLLALRVPVRVADLPEGFVASVQAELALELAASPETAVPPNTTANPSASD